MPSRPWRKNTVMPALKKLMQEEMILEDTWRLDEEKYFGKEYTETRGQIYILMKVPPYQGKLP
jgi:hypothetical protein